MAANKETGSVERLLYRYPEAAFALNMSEDAVQKLVADGQLKVIRPGLWAKGSGHASRVVLIPVSEIRAWIERQIADLDQGGADAAASVA